MTDYGTTLFTFPDPRAPKWALVVLGVTLVLAGGLLLLLMVVDRSPMAPSDAIGLGVMAAVFLLGGPALAAVGIWDLRSKPEWHVTRTHALRARGARVVKAIALRDQATAAVTPIVRYGQVLSVRVTLGRSRIIAPTMDAAQAVVQAWRAARAG